MQSSEPVIALGSLEEKMEDDSSEKDELVSIKHLLYIVYLRLTACAQVSDVSSLKDSYHYTILIICTDV